MSFFDFKNRTDSTFKKSNNFEQKNVPWVEK